MGRVVSVVKKSENSKLGPMACTYAPMQTCPDECPIKGECYGRTGKTGFVVHRLSRKVIEQGETQLGIVSAEVGRIDKLNVKTPLRVHVTGDCLLWQSAYYIGMAMNRFESRTGQVAWTYTHAWPKYPVTCWAGARVRASCESMARVRQAREMGYKDAVLLVPEFESDKAYEVEGEKVVPCPNQTKGIKCIDCQLCARRSVKVIAFRPHGMSRKRLTEKLREVNNGQ